MWMHKWIVCFLEVKQCLGALKDFVQGKQRELQTTKYRQNSHMISVIKTALLRFIYTMFNSQMETQQNTHKCKNFNWATFLGVTHLHRAKIFTMFTTYIFTKFTKLKDTIFLLKRSLSVARLLLSYSHAKTVLIVY